MDTPMDPMETRQTETVSLGRMPEGPPPIAAAPARGTPIGRYLVFDVVGTGGMGVVHAGYDPELDRKVALKLLRPDRMGADRGDAWRLRLLREAQAIARLSHPNVIQVYDVGTFGDQIFLAMEFVQGRSLREWLREGRRSWREVVGLFVLAGRGLAAAHAAGLVHRDFKPDNVLLGDDGRVRVADFGLARLIEGEGAGAAEEEEGVDLPGRGSGELATPITEWGVLLGTPAYMAPEQLRGERADARSDQFSFCTALWESLYGARPFPGDDARELVEGFARGAAPEPPAKTDVPARLRQALLRGLSLDPAARFPSMDALLRELERDPAAARRRWIAAAAVLGLAAAGLAQWGASRARLCRGGEAELAEVWNAEHKAAGRAAFVATGVPFAADSWVGAERILDRYAEDWQRLHRSACEATRVRGEQSEELLDRRMACLDQRLGELRALAGLFAHADAQVVEKAVGAASRLTDPETCSDTLALMARVPLPREPRRRARVRELQGGLGEVKALFEAGKDRQALERVRPLVAAAKSTGYRPLEAEALLRAGDLEDRVGESGAAEGITFEALLAAQAGGDREVLAGAAGELSWIVGHQPAREEEGRRWSRLAQATLEGFEGGEETRARIANRLGSLLLNASRKDEAAASFRQADRWAAKTLGPVNLISAASLSNLAIVLGEQGRSAEAVATGLRALAIRRKLLEPDHPDVGRSYNGLGNLYSRMDRNEEALAMYRSALKIFESRYGPSHPVAAGITCNIGDFHRVLGHYRDALAYQRRCIATLEKVEPGGKTMALALANYGTTLCDLHRYAEALPVYQRSLAVDEQVLGPTHPDLGYDLEGLGAVLTSLGRPAEAVPLLERGLGLREAGETSPDLQAEIRLTLAQALWDAGRKERAVTLVRQVAARPAVEVGNERQAAAVAWLREREGGR